MQKFVVLTLVVVLSSGIIMAYLMYRQLGTAIVQLQGEPDLVVNEQGAACGEVGFEVKARSLAKWMYAVPKGKTITGVVTVGGDEGKDVGFGVWSPANRVVIFEPERAHEVEFEVVGTIRGEYRFEFDNRHSSFSEKHVTVSLCVA